METIKTEGMFEGFVILEIMGHRKLGGYIKEATIAGSSFIRLDTFNETGEVAATQFYNPNSIYCITPTTKQIAIAFGLRNQPSPVKDWELAKRPELELINGYQDDNATDFHEDQDGEDEPEDQAYDDDEDRPF